ncbi:hypothetical protein HIM_03143 [Hirsutella minnesotensis 3608]|nr:hypothetical protein HIM_03143 [Hirsutella minnesotensis 3608]
MSLCKACDGPLVIDVGDEEADGSTSPAETVPDDLELGCGCHYHWECLMEEASSVALSLKCPSCDSFLAVNEAGPSTTNPFLKTASSTPILARYSNEGGTQEHLDILPSITEEAYIQSNPEARPARAMHVMCAEGDVEGVLELLQRVGEEVSDMGSFVRYQDPLGGMKSALHVAVENKREEIVWLMLWLSSTIPSDTFPSPAKQVAESVGLGRLDVQADGDIRRLRDEQGRTAEDVARGNPEMWHILFEAGALAP